MESAGGCRLSGKNRFRVLIISNRPMRSAVLRRRLPQTLTELIDQLKNIQEEQVLDLKLSDEAALRSFL